MSSTPVMSSMPVTSGVVTDIKHEASSPLEDDDYKKSRLCSNGGKSDGVDIDTSLDYAKVTLSDEQLQKLSMLVKDSLENQLSSLVSSIVSGVVDGLKLKITALESDNAGLKSSITGLESKVVDLEKKLSEIEDKNNAY
ncbi:hypothetical protein DPMN_179801 [Dreissena polymorpha]|uniref:Uncharacterized protein n=1 Tax=Dreissena polymorpha TaxID=45954 RepID=A0A9D4EGV6_DREPO|nr:hypothetical protein DPMN_179801 [Dreissena polymorpha]